MLKRLTRAGLWLLAVTMLGLLLVDRYRPAADTSPAHSLLPDLAEYEQVEGRSVLNYIGALANGAALLAGQPHLAAAAGSLDRTVSCLNDMGAVEARLYSQRAQPLAAGAIAVVDLDEISDPATLAQCLAPDLLSLESTDSPPIQLCSATYRLSHRGRTMMVVYAGVVDSVCADFCTHLNGCAQSGATGMVAP